MKILNPDRDRWMTLSEAFNAIGQRNYGDTWDKWEVQEADWDLIDRGSTRQYYAAVGFRFVESGIEPSVVERETRRKLQDRAEQTKKELRRLLFNNSVKCELLARTGDLLEIKRGMLLMCPLTIENGWAGLSGANGEIRISGLLLIDRAQFMKAVAPSGAKGLRELLQTTEANGSRMKKVKLLEVADIYGVSKAAAKEIWKKYAPPAWKVGGRRRSDAD